MQVTTEPNRTYAMKILKKHHIVETRQQDHIINEKNIMFEARSHFVVRYVFIFTGDRLNTCFSRLLVKC